jgi:uncharacterized protein (TIGR02246 family)
VKSGPLEAIEEIKRLKARYFRLMDTKQWEPWGEVFTRDGVLETNEGAASRLEGREAIVRAVSGILKDAVTVHHGHMPEIELTGANTARGIWAMSDWVDMPRLVLRGSGHYEETYRVEDGRWRIAHSRLTRLRRDVERK